MNDGRHYEALGLLPGATSQEIRSAYRRLAKLYHPDQDASLDAEVRYREIRVAYDVLRKRTDAELLGAKAAPSSERVSRPTGARPPNPQKKAHAPSSDEIWEEFMSTHKSYGTAGSAGWWYVHEDESDESAFDFSELMWEYGGRKVPKKRIPFSWGRIPDILLESFREIAGIGMAVRVVLCVWALGTLFGEGGMGWFGNALILFSLTGFLFFRYYFTCDPQEPLPNLIGSMLYSVGVGLIFAIGGFGDYNDAAILSTIGTFFSLLPLWAHPLLWVDYLPTDGPRWHGRP